MIKIDPSFPGWDAFNKFFYNTQDKVFFVCYSLCWVRPPPTSSRCPSTRRPPPRSPAGSCHTTELSKRAGMSSWVIFCVLRNTCDCFLIGAKFKRYNDAWQRERERERERELERERWTDRTERTQTEKEEIKGKKVLCWLGKLHRNDKMTEHSRSIWKLPVTYEVNQAMGKFRGCHVAGS